MKFDEVIGNPPYDKDLHLKILAAITEVCDFETGGVISWLAPVGWLQEKCPWKENVNCKKYSYINGSNNGYFDTVDVITEADANKLFGILLGLNLGIFKMSSYGKFDMESLYIFNQSIFDKTVKKILDEEIKSIKDVFETEKHDFCICLPKIHGHSGNKDIFEVTSRVRERAYACDGPEGLVNAVCFKTQEEKDNFYDSLNTTFMLYWNWSVKNDRTQQSCYPFIPFMEDYTKPWTDERFISTFQITEPEWKYIKNTVQR